MSSSLMKLSFQDGAVEDTEFTSSHGHTTNTLFTEHLLMKKIGNYQDRSSTTKVSGRNHSKAGRRGGAHGRVKSQGPE